MGGLSATITESDIRSAFYQYGEISEIRKVDPKGCAFVTFSTREDAEKAATATYDHLFIKGLKLKVLWGRPQVAKADGAGVGNAVEARQGDGTGPQDPQLATASGPSVPNYFNLPGGGDASQYPAMDPEAMGTRLDEAGKKRQGPWD